MNDYFILNGERTVTPTGNVTEWVAFLEAGIDNRRVDRTEVTEDVEVSTVFLGLNHQFGDGPPLLFETLVFGGKMDGEMCRYSTWDQAVSGHLLVVERVKVAELGISKL